MSDSETIERWERRRALFEQHYCDISLERDPNCSDFYLHNPARMVWEAWNRAIDTVPAEFVTAQDIVDRQARELSEVSAAIGTDAYLDPPDGGSVSLGEQVRRMRDELVGLLQRVYDADQAARHEKPYNLSKLMDDIETVLQRHQK